jgi:hypothetical protein
MFVEHVNFGRSWCLSDWDINWKAKVQIQVHGSGFCFIIATSRPAPRIT